MDKSETVTGAETPDEILVYRDGIVLHWSDDPKGTKYIRADKHTALERVAKEMAEALETAKFIAKHVGLNRDEASEFDEALAAYEGLKNENN